MRPLPNTKTFVDAIEKHDAALTEQRARLHIQKSFEAQLQMGSGR
ncbi:hypothetical protein [Agaricicola taiwanensis]|nr:hypothetical protein [Agaricicola taiwanensis]